MSRRQKKLSLFFLSFLFFWVSAAVLLVVVKKAYATQITITAPTPSPFDFSEVAPNDSNTEVVAPASGPSGAVNGNANFKYNVWVPNTTITLTRMGSGGADSITVSGVNTVPAIGIDTGSLGAGATETIVIGATRDAVAAGKPAGTYTGAYIISVRYTNAGSSVRATTRAFRVKVLTSIGITKTADLNLGETYDGDGSVTVNPTDANSGSGTKLKGPAVFSVTGSRNHAYNVTLPSSVTLTTGDGVGATKQMVVDTFTSSSAGSYTLAGVGGVDTLKVGATRAAPVASQVSGSYSGSAQVTVYYY